MASRIQAFDNLTKSVCLKIHYLKGITDDVAKFSEKFDHIIILKRRNYFDQLLSAVLSERSNIWSSLDNNQRKFIQESIETPIEIDEEEWTSFVIKMLKIQHAQCQGATIVYAEDIIKSESSKEFCIACNLPIRNFNLVSMNDVELGVNKYSMISNVEILRDIFDRINRSWK
jgi:hypothetical protein